MGALLCRVDNSHSPVQLFKASVTIAFSGYNTQGKRQESTFFVSDGLEAFSFKKWQMR